MVAYGPPRNSGWGMQGDTKEQLAKRNDDLLQEIADMRGSQNLWAERAEQMFALQKNVLSRWRKNTPLQLVQGCSKNKNNSKEQLKIFAGIQLHNR